MVDPIRHPVRRVKLINRRIGRFHHGLLWYKRLEKGVFRFPDSNARSIEVEAATLALILEGIDLAGARHRQRFVLRPDRARRESA